MEARPFVGRHAWLKSLRAFAKQPDRPRLTAIYGRRRIGKTRLVLEAYAGFEIMHFEGIESGTSSQQRRQFRDYLYRHSRLEAHRSASTDRWADLLLVLAEYLKGRTCVVFFDEFQWMAAGRNELVSQLKYVWDNHIQPHARVHLVLCGSISSFLVNKVIRSKALYGRIDEVIDLGPLPLSDAYGGFFPRRSVREALEFYLVFGGIPKYLEMHDERRSSRLDIQELCFRPGAYFVDEFDRLFVSHFGKEQLYRSIVEFLSGRAFATRIQIAKYLRIHSGGRLTRLLENLCLAGFLDHYSPIQSSESRVLRRYRIADPYLRFYFRFIRPLKTRIAGAQTALPFHQALPDRRYETFLGLSFEHFCYQHAELIAHRLGFSAVAYQYGSWFRRKDLASGAQIDLLFRRADRVLTLCEVKFRNRVGREVIDEVEHKVHALAGFGNVSIERVLISAEPVNQDLMDDGYFSRILTAKDFVT